MVAGLPGTAPAHDNTSPHTKRGVNSPRDCVAPGPSKRLPSRLDFLLARARKPFSAFATACRGRAERSARRAGTMQPRLQKTVPRYSPVTPGTLGAASLERFATTGEVGGNLTLAGAPEGLLVHYMTNQHAMQLQHGANSPIADQQVPGQRHGSSQADAGGPWCVFAAAHGQWPLEFGDETCRETPAYCCMGLTVGASMASSLHHLRAPQLHVNLAAGAHYQLAFVGQ